MENKSIDLQSILKEAYDNAPEDLKKDLASKAEEKELASSRIHAAANITNSYFNTLEEGQCCELCKSGVCHADCCGCVSILEGHFKILKKFIPDGTEYTPIRHKGDDGMDYIKPITKSFKCVFLSKTNNCLIYKSHLRPEICKKFGEDKTEPLFACVHINPEAKKELEEFARTYLQKQSLQQNPMATHILNVMDETK